MKVTSQVRQSVRGGGEESQAWGECCVRKEDGRSGWVGKRHREREGERKASQKKCKWRQEWCMLAEREARWGAWAQQG